MRLVLGILAGEDAAYYVCKCAFVEGCTSYLGKGAHLTWGYEYLGDSSKCKFGTASAAQVDVADAVLCQVAAPLPSQDGGLDRVRGEKLHTTVV